MLVYNSGTGTGNCSTCYAPFSLGANGTINLVGAPSGSSYLGILFFEDRAAPLLSHTLGGGGAMTLVGTIYLTNTLQTMNTTLGAQYQALSLQGGAGSGTLIQGEIIVGTLSIGGNGSIKIDLKEAPAGSLVRLIISGTGPRPLLAADNHIALGAPGAGGADDGVDFVKTFTRS